MHDFLVTFGYALLAVLAVATIAGGLVLAITIRRLRKIQLPSNAGFLDTLRAVPLGLVVGLDLLDFGLDVFAAPVSWFILRRSGLEQLRNVAVVESLIPGTQLLPTLTLAWLIARLIPPGWEPTWLGDGERIDHGRFRTIDAEFRKAS